MSVRFRGSLAALGADARSELLERAAASTEDVLQRALAIVRRVRARGDEALFGLARDLDGVTLESLEVPRRRWQEAADRLAPELRAAFERAARNIARAHAAQRPNATELEVEPGVVVGRRPDPLRRVGVYAPGGRASYPSSVLMGVVPAKVAEVAEVIVCSPPDATGGPASGVLAAAYIAGADRLFALGGAGAIAAMAYGTESVPAVDRIVGPGNAYVAAAKLLVTERVAIDAPAGPSELLVIADDTADPDALARELVAQAEHDPDACVVALVPTGAGDRLEAAVARLAQATERRPIVEQSLAERGAILETASLDEAIAFANEFAPEHLLVATRAPTEVLARLRNAGTVFLGAASSVAFGDYLTGSNHVLPTAGLARSYSGLSLNDFYRWTSYQRVAPTAAAALAQDVERLARSEGLFAHAAAAAAWRRP